MTPPARPADANVAQYAIACTVLATALLAFVAWKTSFTGLFSDSAIYLLLADSGAAVPDGFDWQTFLYERYPFPPLYPLLLALLGGGSDQPVWTHLIGALTLGLCAGLTVVWLRYEGLPPVLAAGTALSLALTPISLFSAMAIYSEPLYLLLTIGALAGLASAAPEDRAWRTAAVCVGLATVVRTAGIAALAAFIMHWWFATRGGSHRGAPFLALAPTCAWALFKWQHGYDSSYVLSVVHWPLSESVPALIRDIPANAIALCQHGLHGLDVFDSAAAGSWLLVPVLFALAGFVVRLIRFRFDALYLAAYFAVLLLWPHGQHGGRFLFVVTPVMLFHALVAARAAARRVRPTALHPLTGAVPLIVFAAVSLPGSAVIIGAVAVNSGGIYHDYVRTEPWHRHPGQVKAREEADILREITAAITRLAGHVEPGACITSIYPQTVMWLTRRPGLFPAPPGAPDAAFERSMRQCPFVLMINSTGEQFGFPDHFYPRERMGARLEVVDQVNYTAAVPAPAPAAILGRYRTVSR